jgi:signal transduction histidine kinase
VLRAEGALGLPRDRIPVEGTFAGRVAQSGVPLLINDSRDLASDSRLLPHLESLLATPMRLKGTIVGVLEVTDRPGGFTEGDMQVLSLFANGATIAIERARLRAHREQLVVMEERQRLARELHDSATQALYSISLHAEAARLALAAGKEEVANKSLLKVQTLAREATTDLRMLILDLRHPLLEEEGFVTAVQTRLATVESLAGLQTSIRTDGEEHLPATVADELFWIVVEALNNIVRHARAHSVQVALHFDGPAACIEISDDGSGFDLTAIADNRRVGLCDMEERARRIGARLGIESAPGQGTTVRVETKS